MLRLVLQYDPTEQVDAERARRTFRSLGIDVALEAVDRMTDDERKPATFAAGFAGRKQ